jgi:hypothetical protein
MLIGVENRQDNFDETLIEKGFDTMDEQQSSAIFGMHFLQDVKSKSDETITGAYDPKQELWVTQAESGPDPTGRRKREGLCPL